MLSELLAKHDPCRAAQSIFGFCSTQELNFQFSDSGQDCAEDAFGSSASSEDIDIDMNSLDSGTE